MAGIWQIVIVRSIVFVVRLLRLYFEWRCCVIYYPLSFIYLIITRILWVLWQTHYSLFLCWTISLILTERRDESEKELIFFLPQASWIWYHSAPLSIPLCQSEIKEGHTEGGSVLGTNSWTQENYEWRCRGLRNPLCDRTLYCNRISKTIEVLVKISAVGEKRKKNFM